MAAEAATTGGGMDPVTKALELGIEWQRTLQKGLDIFFKSKEERLAYQAWLTSTFPEYKWFFSKEKRADNTWILILIMGVVAIIVVVAVVMKLNRK